MQDKINGFGDAFNDHLYDNAIPICEKSFNLKQNSNRDYSFPQYITKYNGFMPDFNGQTHFESTAKITNKDVKRIIGLDPEHINSYYMEFNKHHYTSITLCETKTLERIFEYFKEGEKNLVTQTQKSPEKENNTNNILEKPLQTEETIACSKKDDKSLFLRTVEVFFYSQIDLKYKICIKEIQEGRDNRTTCMIKNIPNKYTQKMLIDLLNEHHFGCYDFLYLRMDFKNKCNVGYAFVNLIDTFCVISLYKKLNNKGWKLFSSNKIAQLTYASIQGLENLKRKFRKSSVMQEQESFRPKMFYSEGPLKGYERTEF